MVSNQQFRLKWNNHRNTVLQEFETLLHNNSFVDCTIGADGKYLRAHKIVLSACSPYLQNVFSEHFDKHPVILLKDVSFKELKCMIDYMYCGEVNISECELPSFLRTAQSLKIKGLAEDINEYDSASDSEHQELSTLTENGRTVEPNVEIHDDEDPPCKKSAPSLISTSVINSNFSGRKRKSPNNHTVSSKTNNNTGKIANNSSKVTGSNVPKTEENNSDITVCTSSENSINKDESNNKKSTTQTGVLEPKNRTEVKEEPLDADDDNSSYEFVNNPCEDSDPLNEDNESNSANTGKNFSEVSIASVSSCNEGEANDDDYMIEIKEEVVIEEDDDFADEPEECDLPVHSTQESMLFDDTFEAYEKTIISKPKNTRCESSNNERQTSTETVDIELISLNNLPKTSPTTSSWSGKKVHPKKCDTETKPIYRKILPAPIKPVDVSNVSMLPNSVNSANYQNTDMTFTSTQNTDTICTPSCSTYQVVSVPNNMSRVEDGLILNSNSLSTQSQSSDVDPRSIFVLPTTRVMVFNSDMGATSTPVYTLPEISSMKPSSRREVTFYKTDTKKKTVKDSSKVVKFNSTTASSTSVLPVITKFRKIAPLVKDSESGSIWIPCTICFKGFVDEEELKIHEKFCQSVGRRRRRRR